MSDRGWVRSRAISRCSTGTSYHPVTPGYQGTGRILCARSWAACRAGTRRMVSWGFCRRPPFRLRIARST